MTPFGILLVTALFSTQVMQAIAQPKKYRCASLRPSPQPESEPISSFVLRLPPQSVTKSSSTVSKYPGSVSKSSSSVINSSSSVPKSPSSASKSPSSVSKSSSSDSKSSSAVQKVTSTVTNSSRTANRLPPDSFSLFKLPLKLISSLLVPLIPPIVRQNTSSVFSPLFSFQMPLTFSTIHHPSYLPCNTNNSTAIPCNSIPGNTNNLPINFNPSPGISNNLPISFNSLPGNTNNLPIPFTSIPSNTNTLPTPCNSLPGNTNTLPNTSCNSLPGNTNTLPTPCSSLPGNKNNSTNPCNSVSGSTKTLPNPCNPIAENSNNSNNVLCNSLIGNSQKFIIYNWFCNYLLNKIQNISSNIPPIELIPTPNEPNYPLTTENPTVTPIPSDFTAIPTEDIPNNNNTPNDNTPNDNTPNDNTSNDNIPISTPQYPIPPCMFTPINKIHTPCLPLIHIPKPKPCSVPVTYSHSHVPLKYCPPNYGPYSPSYAYFNSLFNPTTYRSHADHNLNPQEEFLLKILKSVISNPNLRSPSISK